MARIEIYAKPSRLYRYRNLRTNVVNGEHRIDPHALDRELKALEQRYIYCPKFTDMNDPMEGLYRASRGLQQRADYDQVMQDILGQKLSVGIASLSESWNNELMWAHYADGFRGICISYSFYRLLEGLPSTCALSRVAYGDRPYYLNFAAMQRQQRARAILSTKNLKWSYEREWRLFRRGTGPARYGDEVVTCVYLGARMSDADQALVRRRLCAAGIGVRETHVDGYAVKRSPSNSPEQE
jgi:Protein of unknown function (DUF2971)